MKLTNKQRLFIITSLEAKILENVDRIDEGGGPLLDKHVKELRELQLLIMAQESYAAN